MRPPFAESPLILHNTIIRTICFPIVTDYRFLCSDFIEKLAIDVRSSYRSSSLLLSAKQGAILKALVQMCKRRVIGFRKQEAET